MKDPTGASGDGISTRGVAQVEDCSYSWSRETGRVYLARFQNEINQQRHRSPVPPQLKRVVHLALPSVLPRLLHLLEVPSFMPDSREAVCAEDQHPRYLSYICIEKIRF